MRAKRNLLIHIGMPKAGSTTLQRIVFPETKKYRYMGKDHGLNDPHLIPVLNFAGNLAYSAEDELLKSFELFADFLKSEEIRRFGNIDPDIPLLLSYETFTTHLFRIKNHHIGVFGADPYRIFSRLKLFGDTLDYNIDLILIERNAKSAIHSWYAEYYWYYRNVKTLTSLKKFLSSEINLDYIRLGLKWYLKGRLKILLLDYFEEANIHAYQFEGLFSTEETNDQKSFSELVGVDFRKLSITAENKRKVEGANNIKNGAKRPSVRTSLSLLKSINVGINAFKESYFSIKNLEVPIEWDDECDQLLNKLIEKESSKSSDK